MNTCERIKLSGKGNYIVKFGILQCCTGGEKVTYNSGMKIKTKILKIIITTIIC